MRVAERSLHIYPTNSSYSLILKIRQIIDKYSITLKPTIMKLAVTGHRPNKLGGYGEQAFYKLVCIFLEYLDENFDTMNTPIANTNPELIVYTGMALGWDQAVAHACICRDVPFIACIPFKGQDRMWPISSQTRYNNYLTYAKEIVVVSEGEYSAHKMQVRNEYMVDRCDTLISMYDGTSGGTANCINYALDKVKIVNLFNKL